MMKVETAVVRTPHTVAAGGVYTRGGRIRRAARIDDQFEDRAADAERRSPRGTLRVRRGVDSAGERAQVDDARCQRMHSYTARVDAAWIGLLQAVHDWYPRGPVIVGAEGGVATRCRCLGSINGARVGRIDRDAVN